MQNVDAGTTKFDMIDIQAGRNSVPSALKARLGEIIDARKIDKCVGTRRPSRVRPTPDKSRVGDAFHEWRQYDQGLS